jgi:hypothetical protein
MVGGIALGAVVIVITLCCLGESYCPNVTGKIPGAHTAGSSINSTVSTPLARI